MRQLLGRIATFVRDSGVETLFTLAIVAKLVAPALPSVQVEHRMHRMAMLPMAGDPGIVVAVAPEPMAVTHLSAAPVGVRADVVLRDVLARENARIARERARAAARAAREAAANARSTAARARTTVRGADCDSTFRVTVVSPDGHISYKYLRGGTT